MTEQKCVETGSLAELAHLGQLQNTNWHDDLLPRKEATRIRTANLRDFANEGLTALAALD